MKPYKSEEVLSMCRM